MTDCTCGSGNYGAPFYDGYGIYCGLECDDCSKEKRAKFRPEIFEGAYECDEPIDSDDY